MARKRKIERYSGFSIRPLRDGSFMVDNNRYDVPGTPREARRRRVKRCATIEDAKSWVDKTATEMERHGISAFALRDVERQDASAAMRILAGRVSLSQSAEFWKKHHPDGNAIPLYEMVARFKAWHTAKGSRPETIREVRRRLGVLVEAFGKKMAIARFSRETLRQFVEERDGGAASKNGWVKTLRAFFGYCEKEEVIPDNPARKLEKVKLPEKAPEFWSAGEVEAVLKAAEEKAPEHAAGFAILFFAGLRPTELIGQYGLEGARGKKADAVMGGLKWADVNLFEGFIRVRGETSKMGQSRLVNISPNLAAWLAKYGGEKEGRVVDNPTGFRRAREKVLEKVERDGWGNDIARHTFATMHFAEHQNRDLLAAQMGHRRGSGMLETHYKGLATAAEARRFWAIAPQGVKLAVKQAEKVERRAEA
jgi:integrase